MNVKFNNTTPLYNSILPDELVTRIQDMACVRKCNSDTASNELILTFGLTETATNVHDTVLQWLFRCLDTISDQVFDGHQYEWHIISNIRDNDYEDVELTTKNTILVAIHTDTTHMSYADTEMTLIPYRYSPSFTLRPQDIMKCLVNEPVFMNRIGVSAVSSDVMMQWWAEMIDTEPNLFDIAGKGYMVHPMWMKNNDQSNDTEWGSWFSIRERSFNFGWKGYEQYISE